MDMKEIYIVTGRKIRKARRRLDLTLDNLSEKAGLGWSFLAKIETGKGVPSVASLYKISHALNMSMKDLFGDNIPGQDKLLERELISTIRALNAADKIRIIKIVKLVLIPPKVSEN